MHLFDRATVDDEVWDEFEELLIGADVGINTAGKLLGVLKEKADKEKLNGALVRDALKAEMVNILNITAKEEPSITVRPRVSLFVGVNGGGKTTSIAKYAHRLQKDGKRVLLVAADTFRAAAIDQLKKWGERVGDGGAEEGKAGRCQDRRYGTA
jgi:fused signal recognition particle receptor